MNNRWRDPCDAELMSEIRLEGRSEKSWTPPAPSPSSSCLSSALRMFASNPHNSKTGQPPDQGAVTDATDTKLVQMYHSTQTPVTNERPHLTLRNTQHPHRLKQATLRQGFQLATLNAVILVFSLLTLVNQAIYLSQIMIRGSELDRAVTGVTQASDGR
eukprot:396025-Rhodomonas_salina.2